MRAIKNRFGAANELGVFAMTERGLKGVANPSALFLSQHAEAGSGQLHPGDAGRARGRLLVEVQALVDPVTGRTRAAGCGGPRSAAAGACCSPSCIATAEWKPVELRCLRQCRRRRPDWREPAADLAILMAVYSSVKNISLRG